MDLCERQQLRRLLQEYPNLYSASWMLLRCYEAVFTPWPGKLLAGSTLASCFKPALQLLRELMRQDAKGARHYNSKPSASSSSSSDTAKLIGSAALQTVSWVCSLGQRLNKDLVQQELSGLPGLPQQSIALLAEPDLYEVLGVAVGEHVAASR
jgi:hypothetical protein